jgi:hypothetical protein
MRIRPSVLALALLLAGGAALAQKQERDAATGDLNPVGKGQHMGRAALKPGAFISRRYRQAVLGWMARQPVVAKAAPGGWEIGKPLASSAALQPLPAPLQPLLPPTPPGNRYVLVGGDVLLIAESSRMVVDAVARP